MNNSIRTEERFARVVSPARQVASEPNIEGTRLVTLERALEIRHFHIDLKELEHKYGIRLKAGDDHDFEIIDERRQMPAGYTFSAFIREDGKLEIVEYVPEDSFPVTV